MTSADREAVESLLRSQGLSAQGRLSAAILSLIAEVREGDAKVCETIAKEAAREAKHVRAHGNDLAWECEKASETTATECAAAIRKGEVNDE